MNEDQDFIDLLQEAGLTDEEIEELVGLGGLYEEQDLLGSERWDARERAFSEGPTMRRTGRVYTAAHPLEHLASGANRVLGGIQMGRIGRRQRDLIEDATGRRAKLLRALLRGRRQPSTWV